jgi:hypothetical protein
MKQELIAFTAIYLRYLAQMVFEEERCCAEEALAGKDGIREDFVLPLVRDAARPP